MTAFPTRPDIYSAPRPSQATPRRAPPWSEGERPAAREWALAFVMTGRELEAAADVEALGYHAFVPMMTVFRDLPPRLRAKLGKRREPVTLPAFPSYVFVGFDPDNLPPTPLYEARHVVSVIRAEHAAQARLATDLDRLRALVAIDPADLTRSEAAAVRRGVEALRDRMAAIVGKPVDILDGPFAGLSGTVEAVRGKDRVEVNLRGARLVLPADAVEETAL